MMPCFDVVNSQCDQGTYVYIAVLDELDASIQTSFPRFLTFSEFISTLIMESHVSKQPLMNIYCADLWLKPSGV